MAPASYTEGYADGLVIATAGSAQRAVEMLRRDVALLAAEMPQGRFWPQSGTEERLRALSAAIHAAAAEIDAALAAAAPPSSQRDAA